MKKSFTPNMDPNAVRELDYRRGYGDVGKYTNPSPISRKEPWNVKTPDHTPRDQEVIEPEADPTENDIKQPEAEMQSLQTLKSWLNKSIKPDFGKPVPERKEGEEKKDYMSRLVSFNRKEGKPQDQAVAIAGHESGVYKAAMCKDEDCDHDDHDYDDMELEEAKKALSGWDIKQKQLKREASSKPKASYVGGNPKPAAPMVKPKAPKMLGGPSHTGSSQGNYSLNDDEDQEDVEKALSTRSFAIPRPMGEYDPFGIQRSATTVPTDVTSKLPKPEGFAPAVRQTLDDVSNRNLTIKPYWEKTTKSCMIHGISYDVQKGCHPCKVTKSMSCSECGEQKVKRPGGESYCPKGHEGSKDASY